MESYMAARAFAALKKVVYVIQQDNGENAAGADLRRRHRPSRPSAANSTGIDLVAPLFFCPVQCLICGFYQAIGF